MYKTLIKENHCLPSKFCIKGQFYTKSYYISIAISPMTKLILGSKVREIFERYFVEILLNYFTEILLQDIFKILQFEYFFEGFFEHASGLF